MEIGVLNSETLSSKTVTLTLNGRGHVDGSQKNVDH